MDPLRPSNGQMRPRPPLVVNASPERGVAKEMEAAFKRSNRIARSPSGTTPGITTGSAGNSTPRPDNCCPLDDSANEEEDVSTPKENADNLLQPQMSPRERLISEARSAEEQGLQKCRIVLDRMRSAIMKQKNISMDIKKGVSELDELLDVIENHRRGWKTVEREQKAHNELRNLSAGNEKTIYAKKDDTPKSNKRLASSTVKDDTGKKHKTDEQEEDWQTVTNRRDKNRNRITSRLGDIVSNGDQKHAKKKIRSEAMLIKPKAGYSYAEVLQNLRSKVKPEESNVKIRAVRKTRNGAILLELDRGEKITNTLSDAIRSSLMDTAETTELTPKTVVEIRDLDSCTSCEEVSNAIKALLNDAAEEFTVNVSAPNLREQKRAVITMSDKNANLLLRNNRIKIGWINCRMRLYSGIKRCYKCLTPGHTQWVCKGPDRRNQCIKCGKSDHRIKECVNKPNCFICVEKGRRQVEHIPGSMGCVGKENKRN